jgi:hypothetical protein
MNVANLSASPVELSSGQMLQPYATAKGVKFANPDDPDKPSTKPAPHDEALAEAGLIELDVKGSD